MSSVDTIFRQLGELEAAQTELKRVKGLLGQSFLSLLARPLQVGTVVDVSLLGHAYNAQVIRGRGYGKHFRITGPLSTNRKALEEFRSRIDALREKLAGFLTPETIMNTLANFSNSSLLPPPPEEEDEDDTE